MTQSDPMARRTLRRRRHKLALALKKQPTQRRAKVTVDTIVNACARLMVERGYTELTTNHVAATAGVGIASLYEYFPGKEAIVAVVAERLVGRVLSQLTSAIPEILAVPPADAPTLWIERIYEVLHRERDLVAVFVREVSYTNQLPAIRAIAPRLLELSRGFRKSAGARVTFAHEAATLHLMINLVYSTIMQLVLNPPADVSKDDMISALAATITRWASGGW